MFDTVTLTNAQWGYLSNLEDWSDGDIFETCKSPDGLHTFRPGLSGTIIPGELDKSAESGRRLGYGFVRPWDDDVHEKELSMQKHWAARNTTGSQDYYVALRNGSPQPDCATYLYGEFGGHLFIHGEDEDGNHLDRHRLMDHLQAACRRIPTSPDFWDPVWVFKGLDKGVPTFDKAMRSDTNVGPSWYSIKDTIEHREGLPDGYRWDCYSTHFGTLTFDKEGTNA